MGASLGTFGESLGTVCKILSDFFRTAGRTSRNRWGILGTAWQNFESLGTFEESLGKSGAPFHNSSGILGESLDPVGESLGRVSEILPEFLWNP